MACYITFPLFFCTDQRHIMTSIVLITCKSKQLEMKIHCMSLQSATFVDDLCHLMWQATLRVDSIVDMYINKL